MPREGTKRSWKSLWMTNCEMMKKGLCFKCGKHGHRAKQCKTKDEMSAADGIRAVQIDKQEQACSWMNDQVCPRSMQWKDTCVKECVGDSLWWQ